MLFGMRSLAFGAVLWVAFGTSACSGSDHDALAARDASSANGGAGGGAIAEAGPLDAAHDADAVDASSDVAPIDSSFVPDGPSVFTFMNGVPNARGLRVCFEAQQPNGFAPTEALPLPESALGLPYGSAFSAETLDGIDLENTAVRPVIYGGDLAALKNKSCDQLTPLPEGVVQAALQSIPAGTLARGRSVLMVAAGCLGGDIPDAGDGQSVCGADFFPPFSNAKLFVASMERVGEANQLGIQVFAASAASDLVTIDHVVALPAGTNVLGQDLAAGEIYPRPPLYKFSVSGLGLKPENNSLRALTNNAPEPQLVVPLTEALTRGGLTLESISNGQNYTVVLVGPRLGTGAGAWHSGSMISVLPSAPVLTN